MDKLEEIDSEEFYHLKENFENLEEAVKAKMLQLGKVLLQRLVDRQANGYINMIHSVVHRAYNLLKETPFGRYCLFGCKLVVGIFEFKYSIIFETQRY